MFESRKISSELMVICLLRIEKTPKSSASGRREVLQRLGSELFVFPAVSVSSKSSHSELPIPLLVFMQTRLFVDRQRRRIPHSEGLVGTNVMIGFGSYECI